MNLCCLIELILSAAHWIAGKWGELPWMEERNLKGNLSSRHYFAIQKNESFVLTDLSLFYFYFLSSFFLLLFSPGLNSILFGVPEFLLLILFQHNNYICSINSIKPSWSSWKRPLFALASLLIGDQWWKLHCNSKGISEAYIQLRRIKQWCKTGDWPAGQLAFYVAI